MKTQDQTENEIIPGVTYRVYRAPDGCGSEYCGEYETLAAAREAAAKEPSGLPEHMYGTARGAGHCGGLSAPENDDDTVEDDEPEGWYGEQGWHCIIPVHHTCA